MCHGSVCTTAKLPQIMLGEQWKGDKGFLISQAWKMGKSSKSSSLWLLWKTGAKQLMMGKYDKALITVNYRMLPALVHYCVFVNLVLISCLIDITIRQEYNYGTVHNWTWNCRSRWSVCHHSLADSKTSHSSLWLFPSVGRLGSWPTGCSMAKHWFHIIAKSFFCNNLM